MESDQQLRISRRFFDNHAIGQLTIIKMTRFNPRKRIAGFALTLSTALASQSSAAFDLTENDRYWEDNPAAWQPLLKAKGEAERIIQKSGIPYTILRSTSLYGWGDRYFEIIVGLAIWSWPFIWLPGNGRSP